MTLAKEDARKTKGIWQKSMKPASIL